jgi:four helix bundle protein
MAQKSFERLKVYQTAEQLADAVWDIVVGWNAFARDAVGIQLVRASDSIAANIAYGCGRRSSQENRRCVRVARGSLNECKHWLRRAFRRKLLTQDHVNALKPLLHDLGPSLNAYLRSIGRAEAQTDANA